MVVIWVPHSPSFLPSLEATSRGVSGATHHGPLPLPFRGCRCTSVSTTAACDPSLNYHRNPISLDTATAPRVGRQLKWIQSKFQTSRLNLCERTSSSLCPGNLRLAQGDGQLWGPRPERCSVRQSSAPGSRADGRTGQKSLISRASTVTWIAKVVWVAFSYYYLKWKDSWLIPMANDSKLPLTDVIIT